MADPKPQQEAPSAIGAVEANDFDSLLKKEFKPKTDEAKDAVETRGADAGRAGAGADQADQRRRRQVDRGDHRRSSTRS